MRMLPPSITDWRGPPVQAMVASAGDAYALAGAFTETLGIGRVIRGAKMATRAGLFDEFGAVLQLRPYFGENFDALEECINDLDWLPAPAYLFIVTDAEQMLVSAPDRDLQVLLQILAQAAEEWSNPSAFPGNEGRDTRSFHILLQVAPENGAAIDLVRDRGQTELPVIDLGGFLHPPASPTN